MMKSALDCRLCFNSGSGKKGIYDRVQVVKCVCETVCFMAVIFQSWLCHVIFNNARRHSPDSGTKVKLFNCRALMDLNGKKLENLGDRCSGHAGITRDITWSRFHKKMPSNGFHHLPCHVKIFECGSCRNTLCCTKCLNLYSFDLLVLEHTQLFGNLIVC